MPDEVEITRRVRQLFVPFIKNIEKMKMESLIVEALERQHVPLRRSGAPSTKKF